MRGKDADGNFLECGPPAPMRVRVRDRVCDRVGGGGEREGGGGERGGGEREIERVEGEREKERERERERERETEREGERETERESEREREREGGREGERRCSTEVECCSGIPLAH